MTTAAPWHAPGDLLAQYAHDPASVDDPTASSIELHLVECAECRAVIAGAAPAADWDAVADRIDAPVPTPAERLLVRLGFHHGHARLAAATTALQLKWLAATAGVVALVIWVSREVDRPGPFLAFAPVIPLAAVAVAFWPGADPAGEAGQAAPLAGVGLVLKRALVVLIPCVALTAAGSLAVRHVGLSDAAWLLPAIGLATGALALSTWVRTDKAAAALTAAWVAALFVSSSRQHLPVQDLAPFTAAGQAAAAAVTVVAVTVIVVRRDAFATARRIP